jgi:hypothetical protein
MKNSAVRHLKPAPGFKSNNNKNIIVALTVEKLSGFGVSCRKRAVHLLKMFIQKMDCLFIAAMNFNNNNQPSTI